MFKRNVIDHIAINSKDFMFDFEFVSKVLKKNNIKTVATQERFIHTFFTSWVNVIIDTYYVASEYAANIIKNSKYHDIKNVIPMGLYRSDYITLYKKKNIPKLISPEAL